MGPLFIFDTVSTYVLCMYLIYGVLRGRKKKRCVRFILLYDRKVDWPREGVGKKPVRSHKRKKQKTKTQKHKNTKHKTQNTKKKTNHKENVILKYGLAA